MAADDVLLSGGEVSETAESRKEAERLRKRKERQKATEAKGKVYRPRLGLRKDPAPVDTSAPLVNVAPAAAVDEIKPGAVGVAQDRANDIVASDVRRPFWWLLRQR